MTLFYEHRVQLTTNVQNIVQSGTCHHSIRIGREVGRIDLTDPGPGSQNQTTYFRSHLNKIITNIKYSSFSHLGTANNLKPPVLQQTAL